MDAMVLAAGDSELRLRRIQVPKPEPHDLLIRVEACGVCRTDLHIVDGEIRVPDRVLVPGHQIVGIVERCGSQVVDFQPGERVGVPWLGRTCGRCRYCRADQENLCERAEFTGLDRDGGFAEYAVADSGFCFRLPHINPPSALAPLLCAGLIGYRAYRKCGSVRRLGLYGFGSSAHLLAQLATAQDVDVYAFTRPGDETGQTFARDVGVAWAGGSDQAPPELLDAAILFAPVGALVPRALRAVRPGGVVVCAGIYMSEIPSFPYADLWMERRLESVANLTREDGRDYFEAISEYSVRPTVRTYGLNEVNAALDDLRNGRFEGSAVLELAQDA